MLYFIMVLFMFVTPMLFYVFFGAFIQIAGEWLYDAVIMGVLKIKQVILGFFGIKNNTDARINKNIKYNLKRKKLKLPRAVPDANGKNFTPPWQWKTYDKYTELNTKYPMQGTKRFRMAKRLNMAYFAGNQYPYDYIVFGDRARLEEARKGITLSREEEALVTLGFGYDGKPFGEPWGIEKECLKGFEYGLARGDFHTWICGTEEYIDSLRKGYAPLDVTNVTNYHKVNGAEERLKRIGNMQHTRLTEEWLEQYRQGSVTPGVKVRSGKQTQFQVIPS